MSAPAELKSFNNTTPLGLTTDGSGSPGPDTPGPLHATASAPSLLPPEEATSPVRAGTARAGTAQGFTRNMLASSLPQLPPRTALPRMERADAPIYNNTPAPMQTRPFSPSGRVNYPIGLGVTGPPPSAQPGKGKGKKEKKQAWEFSADDMKKKEPTVPGYLSPTKSKIPPTVSKVPVGFPEEQAITSNLKNMADILSRKVLPWSAAGCPRAVETLYDLRISIVQAQHIAYVAKMKQKLEEKVTHFMKKKEAEVSGWMKKEIAQWNYTLNKSDESLPAFLQIASNRIKARAEKQQEAYFIREANLARELDEEEKEITKAQLAEFRQVVRKPGSEGEWGNPEEDTTAAEEALFAAQPKASAASAQYQLKALQDSIDRAQGIVIRKTTPTEREVIRKREESFDWLCSLADNAVTAAEAEVVLKELSERLDNTKEGGLDNVRQAINNYKEQHALILAAIDKFSSSLQLHATDYMQREQMVAKAFCQFLLGLIAGNQQVTKEDVYRETYCAEYKKEDFRWESKVVGERCHRKEQKLLKEVHIPSISLYTLFNTSIPLHIPSIPLHTPSLPSHTLIHPLHRPIPYSSTQHHAAMEPVEAMVQKFKNRMMTQLDKIVGKLNSVVNGRETDVTARKASIHKRLAKHVNNHCLERRSKLRQITSVRREDFDMESKCITSVNTLTADLRTSIDQAWMREQLMERRILEAAVGRMERLEKSALVLFEKHAHLAAGAHEVYQDWLASHRGNRDALIMSRAGSKEVEFKVWRADLGDTIKAFASTQVRQPMHNMFTRAFHYELDEPIDKNVLDMTNEAEEGTYPLYIPSYTLYSLSYTLSTVPHPIHSDASTDGGSTELQEHDQHHLQCRQEGY